MRKIIRHTWSLLQGNEKKQFNWLIFCDIVISIIDILSLAALLWVVQFYIDPSKLPFNGWFDKGSLLPITLFFIFFALKNLAGFIIIKQVFDFTHRVAIRISKQNLIFYQSGSFDNFINTDSSIPTRRINFQPFEFAQHIVIGVQLIITQSALILVSVIAIVLFNVQLFLLLMLILVPPVFLVFLIIKRKLNRIKKTIQTSNEKSIQYLSDALKGYVESNVYERNDFFLQRFIRARKDFGKAIFESLAIQNMPGRIVEVFAILGLFILIAIATWTGTDDSNTVLTIGAFMAAAYKIIPGIVKITNTMGQIRAYEPSLHELASQSTIKQQHYLTTNQKLESIKLENVSFSYENKPIIKDVSLEINNGDIIGLQGPSGIGKTTLVNILLGFLTPTHGEILFNNKKVNPENIKEYWPAISYIRQQGFLIHDTLARNISFEEMGHDHARLDLAINLAGLNDLISQNPEGWNMMILENGKNLSGGQQQRIALARALYKNADCIILDEPFNELDEVSELKILETLKSMAAEGKIVILITHNNLGLSHCNKIVSLNGKG